MVEAVELDRQGDEESKQRAKEISQYLIRQDAQRGMASDDREELAARADTFIHVAMEEQGLPDRVIEIWGKHQPLHDETIEKVVTSAQQLSGTDTLDDASLAAAAREWAKGAYKLLLEKGVLKQGE